MNSSNVLEIPCSDIDSPSSVDYRDSDNYNSTSTYDSDSRYLLPASIFAPHAGAHAHHADSWILMSHSTAKDYANAIRSSNKVFGSPKQTNSIKNLLHNTSKSTKSPLTIMFFESLVENETLSSLASFDNNDTDNGNQPIIHRFYLICRGLRRNSTKEIINTAVLWFATKFFKKKSPLILKSGFVATAIYQPNTAKTKLKDLFHRQKNTHSGYISRT